MRQRDEIGREFAQMCDRASNDDNKEKLRLEVLLDLRDLLVDLVAEKGKTKPSKKE